MAESVLRLNTKKVRRTIEIEDEGGLVHALALRGIGELSVTETVTAQRLGELMGRMGKQAITPEEAAEMERLLTDVSACVLVDAPADLLAQLSAAQRMELVAVFCAAQKTPEALGAMSTAPAAHG